MKHKKSKQMMQSMQIERDNQQSPFSREDASRKSEEYSEIISPISAKVNVKSGSLSKTEFTSPRLVPESAERL